MRKSPTIKYLCWFCTFVLISFIIITPTGFQAFSQNPFTPTPNAISDTQVIESDSSTVFREGSWESQPVSSASGGSYLYSSGSEQDVLTLPFSGTTIEVLYVAGPNLGTLAVEVDDTVLRTVITTADQTAYRQAATVNYLTDEAHTLRVYAQEGGIVAVDAFVTRVTVDDSLTAGPRVVVPADDPAYQIAYNDGSSVNLIYTSTTARTAGSNGTAPAWSPTGIRIVYLTTRPVSGEAAFGMLERDDQGQWTDRGIFAYLGQGYQVENHLAWSPDGTKIAYAAWLGGSTSIYYLDMNNCTLVNNFPTQCPNIAVTHAGSGVYDTHPSWSPDGTRLVFSSNRGGKHHLYTVHFDGTQLTRIYYAGFSDGELPGTEALTYPEWSPDGTQFAVVRSTGNFYHIETIDADGSNLTRVTTPTIADLEPTWSPDGTQLAFSRYFGVVGGNPVYHIYTLNLSTQQVTQHTPGLHPKWRRLSGPYCFMTVTDGIQVRGSNEQPAVTWTTWNGVPYYNNPFDARTVRFEGVPSAAGLVGVFAPGTQLQVGGYYNRSSSTTFSREAEPYVVSITHSRVPPATGFTQLSAPVWISIAAVRGINPNAYVDVVNQDSICSSIGPDTTTVYTLTTPQTTIEDIRDYGVDIRAEEDLREDPQGNIVPHFGWEDAELDQILLGLQRTADALQLTGVQQGRPRFIAFRTVMICGITSSDPQKECNNGAGGSAVPDYMLFIRLPRTEVSGSWYHTYYEEYTVDADGNTVPNNNFVNEDGCKTIQGGGTELYPRRVACRGNLYNPTSTIGSQYGAQIIDTHVVVHELGHVFDNRSGAAQGGLLERIDIGYVDPSGGPNFFDYKSDSNARLRDCGFVTFQGQQVRILYMTDEDIQSYNNANPRDGLQRYSIGTIMGDWTNNDTSGWTRGTRGWGTILDTNSPYISDFQINPSEDSVSDNPNTLTTNETVFDEQSEAAADMFLNWVYRITSPTSSIPNLTSSSYADDACTFDTTIGNWEGFRNIDGAEASDSSLPGNRRYWWMHREVNDILTDRGWK